MKKELQEINEVLQKYKELALDEIRDKAIAEKEEEIRILRGEK